jgi:hypothetical protein
VRSDQLDSEADRLYQWALDGNRTVDGTIRAWVSNYIIVDQVEAIVRTRAASDGYEFRAWWDDTGTETWLIATTSQPNQVTGLVRFANPS